MVVQRSAAALAARHPDLAAVLLQDAGRRQGRLREEGVGGAADEQGDAGSLLPLGRQHLRQPAVMRLQRGTISCIRRNEAGSRRPMPRTRPSSRSFCASRSGASAQRIRPA